MKKIFQLFKFFCLFIAILLVIPGCVTKMSLEEAKKVSLAMDEKPLVKPPRRINDILAVLDQAGQFDTSITSTLKADAAAVPPDEASNEALATFYYKKGNAERLLGYQKEALDDLRMALLYQEKVGKENPTLLATLGFQEIRIGNLQRAIELLERSLKDINNPIWTYKNLTDAYIMIGDLEKAEEISRQANRFISSQDRKRRNIYNEMNMGEISYRLLDAQGKYAEAEQYLRQMLDQSTIKNLSPRWLINTRSNLSSVLRKQQRLLEAETEARHAVKEALGFGGSESAMTTVALKSMARIMLAQGRVNDAERLIRATIRMVESSGIPSDSHSVLSNRMFLGDVLSRKKNYPEAMRQFDLVRDAMNNNPQLYESLVTQNRNVMLTLLKTGRIDEAMRIIPGAYEVNQKRMGENHQQTIQILGLRGMANAMAGNNRQAFEDFSSALPALMKQGAKQDDGPNQIKRAILETYIDFLGRISDTPLEQELGIRASDEAFRIAGYLSSQSTQTALGESSARAAASYDPQLSDFVRQEQDMGKQISALQETLSEAMMVPPDQQEPKALNSLKTTIENQTRARDLILNEINRRFPKYANFTSPQPVTIDKVRESLQQNESLISIFTADEKTYVWAVPKKGETRFSVISIGKKELTQIVAHLRSALDPNPSTLGDIPAFDLIQAYDLYRKILQPVAPAWKEAKDLLVTVSGPLGNLPLSLLPTEPVKLTDERGELFANYRQVPWLVRKASVTMLPAVNALVTLRSLLEGDPKRKAFAGFGDPVFNREQLARDEKSPASALTDKETPSSNIQLASRGTKVQVRGVRVTEKGNLDSDKIASAQLDGLERLPDTADEIRSIARVLKADAKSDISLGKDFSQERLQTMNLSDRRVIAFATHALVPGDLDGLDQPALALSSPAVTGGKGDGLLTTDEILKMKLNADWVVLSACNTGAAEGKGAEAVSGLGKAFFYAGTRALLVSMWSVETTSAQKLVTGIFQSQEKNKGLSRAQALQTAILNLIDKDTMKDNVTGKIVASYAHPLFWAPFVIVGDPGKSL